MDEKKVINQLLLERHTNIASSANAYIKSLIKADLDTRDL